jgi:hypothetical protein
MTKDKLFEIYKNNYFHEMDVRDKFIGRIQLNFALVAAIFTLISYMVRMIDYDQSTNAISIFWVLIVVVCGLSIGCLTHLLKAYWGNEYKGMPSATDSDNYRIELVKHRGQIKNYNLQYPSNAQPTINVDKTMKLYLYSKYRDCSSFNTDVNDIRSAHIHQSFKWLLFLLIPFILAGCVFIFGNLDVSSPRKETPIKNVSATTELNKISFTLNGLEKNLINFTKTLDLTAREKLISSDLNNIVKELSNLELTIHKYKEELIMSNNKSTAPPPPVSPSQPEPRKIIENKEPKPKL